MKSIQNIKLEEALKNADVFIKQRMKMDDEKLSRHIDLFRQQMEMAYKQNNKDAYELLYEYEKQTIIARIKKDLLKDNSAGKIRSSFRRSE
ncbi:MAG: hypothetical protein FJY07_08035 [Bacteroidetes bacterium]|nr:hypothetical protein [Bacteroidota bacterium]